MDKARASVEQELAEAPRVEVDVETETLDSFRTPAKV
jgi:hypothetical protein